MNIIKISEKFPADIDAINYFESYRWKDGCTCLYCKEKQV